MPRQVRIEFPGAMYHVMCRGDRRENIFLDDGDREMMLATLAETVGKTGWQVHAWVWMSNHYHLLVETPEANLVKGMTWFQTTYTIRFNARHHLRGPLFGGRYKAVLVDGGDPNYFSTLLDYIHLNPVRARLIDRQAGGDLRDYHGEEIKAHGESRARALLATGLAAAGLKVSALSGLPKSDRRKVVIATQIRQQTAMPLAWIAAQLHMGTPSHVSHTCRRNSSFRLS